jgi:hypothetical protein
VSREVGYGDSSIKVSRNRKVVSGKIITTLEVIKLLFKSVKNLSAVRASIDQYVNNSDYERESKRGRLGLQLRNILRKGLLQ